MKVWLRALTIAIVLFSGVVPAPNCNPKILDECSKSLFFAGYTNFKKPKGEDDIISHCQDRKEGVACIKDYANNCLDPLQRQVVLLTLHGAAQTINRMCSKDGIKEALKHFPCITDAIPKMRPCMLNVLQEMEGVIQTYRTADERIPVGCCSLHTYSKCTSNALGDICPEDTNKYYEEMIEGYSSDMYDLACTGYEMSEEECSKVQVRSNKNETDELRLASLLPHALEVFGHFS